MEQFVNEMWRPGVIPTLRSGSSRYYDVQLRCHISLYSACEGFAISRGLMSNIFLPTNERTASPVRARTVCGLQSRKYCKPPSIGIFSNRILQEGFCIGDRAPKTERLYLNPKEVGRLLDSLSEPCRTLVLVAVLTGMRIGEILALRWKAIDLGRGSIQVRETVSEGKFGAPKTKSSRRDIPMSQPVLKHFMRSLAAVGKEARRISYSQPVIRLHSIRKTCFAASCDRPARLWDCPSSHGAASGIRMQRSLPKLESQSVRPKHFLAIRTLKRLLMSTRTPSLKHNGVPSTKSLKFCSLMFTTFQWLQKMKRSTN